MGCKTVPLARFWRELVTILPEIAKSEYVAIDFEMTGIEPRRAPKLHKPTKDEIYQRAKQATETFNAVQFGITCIVFDDEEKDTVHLKSYNFNVSPMFDTSFSGVDTIARTLDRTLTLSYKTLMFLKRNRIRIEDAYDGGIYYLSRAEEAELLPELFATSKHGRNDDILLEEQKPETMQFYYDTMHQIRSWAEKEEEPDRLSYLNIVNPHQGPLTRFQRRLVYQMLDTEFGGRYRATVNGNFFMQITEKDAENENKRGLRYIAEALVGGDFANDVWSMYKQDNAMVEPGCEARLRESEAKLKEKRPVLVGHNMFHDLCFFHATFFSPLPNTLDEFDRIVHELFPRIIDTKHILKRDDNEMMPSKSLEEVFVDIEGASSPFKIAGERAGHADRLHHVNEHQAGHDSYKTSVVFLKEMWRRVDSTKKGTYSHKLLLWENSLVKGFANKVRLGNAGLWPVGRMGECDTMAK
ncbi:hypothetical protein SPBR_07021 [Sporothrix brasiliensis 5110]|uniref:Uncharacterized protein n=1 Tax=Sporothrix brasiliensis 5110 TaxID=1398154 RepID=A0A0C2IMQ1_9PEZI|nr:uncharacterized protein SPBR_07021 [Sporothrix brasiliensis 5110]KIH88300.1 hypothetical protein SPBR_07021 [Sporothrix brasiliensis 5110]